MSYSEWGHKESHPNRHGRGDSKGTPAPGKNARGKKAKYSKSGSSRSKPLPKRAEVVLESDVTPVKKSAKKAAKKAAIAQRKIAKEQTIVTGEGKPNVRASAAKSVRARLHGNPSNHHFVGHR